MPFPLPTCAELFISEGSRIEGLSCGGAFDAGQIGLGHGCGGQTDRRIHLPRNQGFRHPGRAHDVDAHASGKLQRGGAGEVEIHAKTHHVFIIVEGEATFVTGGTPVGLKDTAPDQKRAASVTGGQTYHLTKGDVITIPAKTPHWFKEVSTGSIAYYAINTEP